VRASGDSRKRFVRTLPTRENISDGVFAQNQSGIAAKFFYELAPLTISFGKDDARDDGRCGFRDEGEFVYLVLKPLLMDRQREHGSLG
jgi:hypothetical protein